MKRLPRAPISLLLAAACAAPAPETEPVDTAARKVWLDVDPATGLHRSEVDDGLALIQAFRSPELRVRGVSVVYGNTSLEQAVPVAREIVSRFGPPGLEVASGAAGAEERGRSTAAVEAMAAALQEAPMTLLALGPVTNVASLLELHPQLHERIEAIVMVAARRPGQHFYPRRGDGTVPDDVDPSAYHRDFNFELDSQSMAVVLRSDVPLVFAPWEVSSWVWLRRSDIEGLRDASESGTFVAEACASWLDLWQESFGVDGFNPFDTLAVGWMSHPQLMEALDARVWIEEGPDDRQGAGGEATKPYLLVSEEPGGRRAVYLARPHDSFHSLLLQRLEGPPV